jgi:hypothetical protein
VAVEIEDGKITLFVYGDINSPLPTQEIDLSGAMEKCRERVVAPIIEEAAE